MIAKKRNRRLFPLALVIYAVIFLGVTAFGLRSLWDYMDAYECSRPQNAVDAYAQQLTPEYICKACASMIEKVSIQSKEARQKVVLDALMGEITCAKNASLSTDTTQVYMIMCGKQVIGSMEMQQQGESRFGFTPWVVTKDSFDLSYLLTETFSVTVPSNYPVYFFGTKLTENFITEDHIPYPALKEYYGSYSLPYMVTYTAGPFLGQPELLITDPAGTPVQIDENTDLSVFLNNCSPEEISALDAITDSFVHRYVDFISETKNDTMGNYQRLTQHLVPDGDLANRMYLALGGLNWVSDRNATVTALDIHRYVSIGDGRYFCDLSYEVTNKTNAGESQSVNHIKVIYLKTESGLKAETMVND